MEIKSIQVLVLTHLSPLKTSENRKFFNMFLGEEKRYIGKKWVNVGARVITQFM